MKRHIICSELRPWEQPKKEQKNDELQGLDLIHSHRKGWYIGRRSTVAAHEVVRTRVTTDTPVVRSFIPSERVI